MWLTKLREAQDIWKRTLQTTIFKTNGPSSSRGGSGRGARSGSADCGEGGGSPPGHVNVVNN